MVLDNVPWLHNVDIYVADGKKNEYSDVPDRLPFVPPFKVAPWGARAYECMQVKGPKYDLKFPYYWAIIDAEGGCAADGFITRPKGTIEQRLQVIVDLCSMTKPYENLPRSERHGCR